jgi:hypothetical protein
MKEQDEIKDLFKGSFDGFEVTPPASVKINVDQKVKQIQSIRKMKWFLFAGISVFLLALTVLLFSQGENKATNANLASNRILEYDDKSTNGISERGDKPSKHISQYGDKTNMASCKEIDHKLNLPSSKNQTTQITNNSSKSIVKSINPDKLSNSNTSKKTDQTSNEKQAAKQKKSKNVISASKTKNILEAENNHLQYNKKIKKDRNKDKKSKIEKIEVEKFEKSYKMRIDENVDGQETIAATFEKNNQVQNKTIDSNMVSNIDSLKGIANDSLEENKQILEIKKKKRTLLLSLKTGSSLGFNQVNGQSNLALKEKSSFFIQTEIAYYLNSKMAISSGFNYQNNLENISQDQTILGDSMIVSYNYIYVLDSMQIIVDSLAFPVYGQDSTAVNFENSYQVYSIGVPIMFQYTFDLSPKIFLDLSAGAILNLQGSKSNYENLNTSNRTENKFGVKACLRSQLRYQFSNWGVSLNTNFGYDFKPVQSWENVKRKRSYLDFGIGIHYMLK